MPQVISSPRAGSGDGESVATENLEFELLCACCVSALFTSNDERIAGLMSPGVRWDVLLEQAEFHNVEPLICAKLLEFRASLPSNVDKDLERRFATNAQRSLRLTRELTRILACLENHSVDAIPYKGPALAQAIYGDVAMRQFSDLDILIRASDFDRAGEAVRELGYEPSTKLRAPVERAWLKTGYERGFDGPQGKNLLELQWRAAPQFYAVGIDVEDWFRRATYISLGERKVRALAPEDLLLALCVHACVRVAGAEAVYTDLLRAVIDGHGLRQENDRAFRCAIDRCLCASCQSPSRGHVNDRTAARLFHEGDHVL